MNIFDDGQRDGYTPPPIPSGPASGSPIELRRNMDNLWMLKASVEEITRLRERNKLLDAQVAVMEVFAAALGFKRGDNVAEVDLVWKLKRAIEDAESSEIRSKMEKAGG